MWSVPSRLSELSVDLCTWSGEPSSGPIVDMSPGVALSIRRANFVAITYSSRWP